MINPRFNINDGETDRSTLIVTLLGSDVRAIISHNPFTIFADIPKDEAEELQHGDYILIGAHYFLVTKRFYWRNPPPVKDELFETGRLARRYLIEAFLISENLRVRAQILKILENVPNDVELADLIPFGFETAV